MSPEGPFPDCHHLASWATVCPGNNENAGKRRSGRTRQGNRWLRSTLTQTAWAGAADKKSLFKTLYERVKLRRGGQRAVLAVAHAQLIAIFGLCVMELPIPNKFNDCSRTDARPKFATISSG